MPASCSVSAIHRAVELHFRRLLEGQAAPSTAELLDEYREGWKDHSAPIRFGKDEDDSSLNSLADKMLTAFSTSDVAKPTGRILAVEESLRGEIVPGLPDLLGRVDLIVEEPDELVIWIGRRAAPGIRRTRYRTRPSSSFFTVSWPKTSHRASESGWNSRC